MDEQLNINTKNLGSYPHKKNMVAEYMPALGAPPNFGNKAELLRMSCITIFRTHGHMQQYPNGTYSANSFQKEGLSK